jgi:hypothetical protein
MVLNCQKLLFGKSRNWFVDTRPLTLSDPTTSKTKRTKGLSSGHAPWVRGAPRHNTRAPHPAPASDAGPNLLGSCMPCAHAEGTSRARCQQPQQSFPLLPRALVRAVAHRRQGARPSSALRARACRAIHRARAGPVRPVPARPRASQNVRAPPPLTDRPVRPAHAADVPDSDGQTATPAN